MNGLALALDELRRLRSARSSPWRQFAPGVSIHRLWGKPDTRSGALLRYAPGAKIRAASPRGDRAHLRAHRHPARRARRICRRRPCHQPARIGPHGVQSGRMRGVRGLGAAQHVPRRVALTCLHVGGGWEATLDLGFAQENGATRLARRSHRGPLVVQRPFSARRPGRLSRLRPASAGRAGRRRRADDRRRGGRGRPRAGDDTRRQQGLPDDRRRGAPGPAPARRRRRDAGVAAAGSDHLRRRDGRRWRRASSWKTAPGSSASTPSASACRRAARRSNGDRAARRSSSAAPAGRC